MKLSRHLAAVNQVEPAQTGMTMIELLIAMSVLLIGMGAMLTVFAAAITGNGRAKADTSGTMLAQTILEQIAAQPQNQSGGPPNMTVTDCSSTAWTVATAAGGANLDSTYNLIDWTQTYSNVPTNYKMQYVACGSTGRKITFDVRWNVSTLSSNARLIVVSARPVLADSATGSGQVVYAQPITLRTIGGV